MLEVFDLALIGGKVFLNDEFVEANVYIKDGKISAVGSEELPAERILKVTGLFVLPGFIDPHVHFSLKLGPHRSADDFYTGGKAAACGGVTTVGDFTEPCSTEQEIREEITRRVEEASNAYVDYFLHLTIANPEIDPDHLCRIALDSGINSIKLFTTYSSSKRRTDDWYILQLLKAAAEHHIVVMVHAENDEIIEGNARKTMRENNGHLRVKDLAYIREPVTEIEAVSRVAMFAKWTGSKVYMAHVSSGLTIDHIQKAFGEILGRNLFIESCPHYFWLDQKLLYGEEGYRYAVCPPLRSYLEIEHLKAHLKSGHINTIGTDHCPFNLGERVVYKDRYELMPNGLPGVEVSFVLMHTMAGELHLPVERLIPLFSRNPAKIMGILHRKGEISPGKDADLVVFDPKAEWTITQSRMHSANDYTPYEGLKVRGRILHTILRGHVIVEEGEPAEEKSLGKFVKRGDKLHA